MSLFGPTPTPERAVSRAAPLAERMRPRRLDEYVGPAHRRGADHHGGRPAVIAHRDFQPVGVQRTRGVAEQRAHVLCVVA